MANIKTINLGFIVINPEKNISHLHTTLVSVRSYYRNSEVVHILPQDADKQDIKESKAKFESTFKGGENEISMINTGFKKLKSDWGVIIRAGSMIRPNLHKKYGTHHKNYKDIFYPISISTNLSFLDTSLNGVAINKKFFKEVGNFPENKMWKSSDPDFNMFKILWTNDALNLGCKFKAVLGCQPN